MLKTLSIKNYFRKIRGIINDIRGRRIYIKYLPELYSDTFFQKYRRELKDESMLVGIDILPEIKLQYSEIWDLENEEKRRLAVEVSKFNDIFAKHGLLEFVKMIPRKVDSETNYGFVIELIYNKTFYNIKNVIYVILYTLSLLGLLGTLSYFLIGHFLIG